MSGRYDAVIVGAGIGGLVCGCLLAKQGMKTLIAERHFQPGGCCTSFKRNGFVFDAGGHFFGGLRPGGAFRAILEELGLSPEALFLCADPIDKLVFPDFTVDISRDFRKTAAGLKQLFPDEAVGIDGFFEEATQFDYTKSLRYRGKPFRSVLARHFRRKELMAVFDILLLYIGLTSSGVSALSALLLFKEFICDGGYYPKGGMQALSDRLAETFQSYGGTLALSEAVTAIRVSGEKRCAGVTLLRRGDVDAAFVVSNADARRTFGELIDAAFVDKSTKAQLATATPSVSHFVTYMGLSERLPLKGLDRCNTWYVPGYDIDAIYQDMIRNPLAEEGFVHIAFPSFHDPALAPDGCDSAFITLLADYRTKAYWDGHRGAIAERLVWRIDKRIPGFADRIVCQGDFTPHSIERYTQNSRGANYGWAMTPGQSGFDRLTAKNEIRGLYLAGHWTRPGCGLATAAQSGAAAARMIIKDYGN